MAGDLTESEQAVVRALGEALAGYSGAADDIARRAAEIAVREHQDRDKAVGPVPAARRQRSHRRPDDPGRDQGTGPRMTCGRAQGHRGLGILPLRIQGWDRPHCPGRLRPART